MAKTLERDEAHSMRRKGVSITKIATTIGVSKSTVSYWCRDIVLSEKQLERLISIRKHAGQASLIRIAEAKRTERIEITKKALQRGAEDVGTLTKRDLFMIGLALYWGEGYKSGNEECGFTNSDPKIINVYIHWLTSIYKIKKDDLILRVSINKLHEHREKSVMRFWSRTTNIPLSQFTTTSFIQSRVKKHYTNTKTHYGTLRIKVRRGSMLRRQIMGSLAHIAETH